MLTKLEGVHYIVTQYLYQFPRIKPSVLTGSGTDTQPPAHALINQSTNPQTMNMRMGPNGFYRSIM